ncbi:MAG: 7-carboxy-7-deazaguanine synthase QueE [Lentisphaeria bacterium]
MKKLLINELFYSLQGEGPLAGEPAIFLRLTGCIPPFCSFCDTPASLNSKNGSLKSVETIFSEIKSIAKCSLIVITGGEPFLQWNSGLSELDNELLNSGYRIQYETSGKALIPTPESNRLVVCSPKQQDNFTCDNWLYLKENTKNVDFFKFIYSENLAQIKNFITNNNIDNNKVFLMPEGKTKEEQLAKLANTWMCCSENGWKLSPRLHILAFDEKKGI